jgi:hypothetical protein
VCPFDSCCKSVSSPRSCHDSVSKEVTRVCRTRRYLRLSELSLRLEFVPCNDGLDPAFDFDAGHCHAHGIVRLTS